MVEPSSLADTVTPSSFWPDGDEITPLSNWSAAWAPVTTTRLAAPASSRLRRFLIDLLLVYSNSKFLHLSHLCHFPLRFLDGCALLGLALRAQPLIFLMAAPYRACIRSRSSKLSEVLPGRLPAPVLSSQTR